MQTKSRHAVCLLFEEFEVLDVASFAQVLSMAGRHWNWRPFHLHTVAATRGLLASTSQLCLQVEHDFDSCPAAELLFIPGGYGARAYAKDSPTRDFVKRQASSAQVVVSVAQGSLLLAASVTEAGPERLALSPAHQQALDQVLDGGAWVRGVDTPWLESGKFLSAQSSVAALDASLCALSRVLGAKLSQKVAHEIGAVGPTLSVDLSGALLPTPSKS
ncbi:MAG: hypothetical protein RJA70_2345 [Pseudomonadota bacterium]|jgi:transcriptional regulator GlxA family with amidase domain